VTKEVGNLGLIDFGDISTYWLTQGKLLYETGQHRGKTVASTVAKQAHIHVN
jgi:hypothetical protein